MEQINIDKIDIYEVDKKDYEAYFYRLPKNEIIKTTPREKLTIWKDLTTGFEICGYETTQIMGTDCNRFFIFNFIEEERLGDYKTTGSAGRRVKAPIIIPTKNDPTPIPNINALSLPVLFFHSLK